MHVHSGRAEATGTSAAEVTHLFIYKATTIPGGHWENRGEQDSSGFCIASTYEANNANNLGDHLKL